MVADDQPPDLVLGHRFDRVGDAAHGDLEWRGLCRLLRRLVAQFGAEFGGAGQRVPQKQRRRQQHSAGDHQRDRKSRRRCIGFIALCEPVAREDQDT